MIAAVDVSYSEDGPAAAAAVVFHEFTDAETESCYTARVDEFGEYEPGRFFRRELPCLMAVLEKVNEPLETVIIDGYVMLGRTPGLGCHLFRKMGGKVSVVGVAKTAFPGADPVIILRGGSSRPLYITSIGMDPDSAAEQIKRMRGSHRIPTLLKRVDQLTRQ